jgi:hypothetical protein
MTKENQMTTKPTQLDPGAAQFIQDAIVEATYRSFLSESISALLDQLQMEKHAANIVLMQSEASLPELIRIYSTCALLVILRNRIS